jgi:phytoene synthase
MSRDTSFYYSFLVLPPRKRRAIVAVWDFCRAVDDAVDEPERSGVRGAQAVEEGRMQVASALAMWRREVAALYGEGEPVTPQGQALRPVVVEFGLPREELAALVDGVEMDVGHVCYPTFEALSVYCRHVAGTVGLICLEIFGYRDRASRDYALNLALALQLTNIIRDVAADQAQGRVYLPTEDLTRFGVGVDELAAGRLTPPVRALLEFECARTRAWYRRAASSLPASDRQRLVAAEIMGGIYLGILDRIERAGYDVFGPRIRVPRPARLRIALTIWVRALLGLAPLA